jgi:hypothetical protein
MEIAKRRKRSEEERTLKEKSYLYIHIIDGIIEHTVLSGFQRPGHLKIEHITYKS